jgi:hypothetical protein
MRLLFTVRWITNTPIGPNGMETSKPIRIPFAINVKNIAQK